jgi:putative ABC transport system permease protein
VRLRTGQAQETGVSVIGVDARRFCEVDNDHVPRVPDLDLYRQMAARPGTVLVTENFAALHGVKPGEAVTLSGVRLRVLGQVPDFSWGHGKVIMDWRDYAQRFGDTSTSVDLYEVYLYPGANAEKVRDLLAKKIAPTEGLVIQTRRQFWDQLADAIERIYSVAYGQQIIVGVVAALGVVTALLIAVLQRRRELGVLRAIGASRSQVVCSFLAEATLMGLIGTVIGLVVGVPFDWYVLQVLIPEESGYSLPVIIPWAESGVIAVSALAIATLAGLWPALHAVRQRIPEAIAHE